MSATYKHMNTLRQPVITEKSYIARAASNQYVFRVATDASKVDVKAAVEAIFEVQVEKVQVINVPGKEKRRRHECWSSSGLSQGCRSLG